jgi:phosphoribosylaminoimidazolecarboxamide formyltransferase/IMP cyclohydrolase
VLIAPKIADDARTLLAKKENVRVLEVPLSAGAMRWNSSAWVADCWCQTPD